MFTAHRRRIAWIALAALLLQVLSMSVHHVAYGKLASPGAATHAAHDSNTHHHSHDQHQSSATQSESSPCSFWLTLHAVARYVPPFVAASAVRPVPADVVVRLEAPVIPPQYLLTDLSSRGPPSVA